MRERDPNYSFLIVYFSYKAAHTLCINFLPGILNFVTYIHSGNILTMI